METCLATTTNKLYLIHYLVYELYLIVYLRCLATQSYIVSRARRLKYVWSRLPRFYKRSRNVGDTNQIAERSIITKLLRVSHMTVCPFQTRFYREKSVSESYELARLRPTQERVISFEINGSFRRWCLKCTGQLEQNRKHMLCRITVKLPTFLRLHR